MRCLFLLLGIAFHLTLSAQNNRIILDENFDDWQNVSVAESDPLGDNGNSLIDFGNLWISNDDDFIFFRIEVGEEINLQNNNDIIIFIDGDNNPNTGFISDGIGAELTFNFGNRIGGVYAANNNTLINHNEIQLVTSPTVTSNVFEIAIGRDLNFFGQSLFQGDEIKVVFKNNSGNGDKLPDSEGGVSYTFNNNTPTPLPDYSLSQSPESQLRIMSYNVLFDNLFENSLQDNFERIIHALDADIIGFQEIYDYNAQQTADKVQSFLPLNNGAAWYSAKVEPDIIVVSKYPILSSHLIGTSVFSDKGNGAFLIELDPVTNTKLLFIVAHFPCCNNEEERQQEIDALMAFIRNTQAGTSPITISPNDPIVIVGDMNLVGFQQQQQTLITGDILDEQSYGADFNPDWDGTALEDAKPITTNLPLTMTWYNEGSSFGPGRLDYLIYSGSVLDLKNSFSLFTPALTQTELTAFGLSADDVLMASDHLPLIGDFDLDISISAEAVINQYQNQLSVFPNPISENSQILLNLDKMATAEIVLLDINGTLIQTIYKGSLKAGSHTFQLTKKQLQNGVYICRLKTSSEVISKKIIVSN